MRKISLYQWSSWLFQNMIYFPCRFILRFRLGLRVENETVLGDYTNPLLLAVSPHTNILDIILVPAALPRHLLPVRWVADRKIFTKWYRRIWLSLWGAVPVGRSRTGRFEENGADFVLQMLKKNRAVAIFPECCLIGGSFSDIHQELFSSVINSNVPVVPVNMEGMKALRKRNFILGKIKSTRIVFGSPIQKSDHQDWSSATVMANIVQGFFEK